MRTRSKGERYDFWDSWGQNKNVGRSLKGTSYILDGDAVRHNPKPFPVEPHAQEPWINADGTWKQYDDFKELHKRFDSELHRGGGRILSPGETILPIQTVTLSEPAVEVATEQVHNAVTLSRTATPSVNSATENTWNLFSREFWNQEHSVGRRGLAIAGGTVILGAVIYGVKKIHDRSTFNRSWAERSQKQNNAGRFRE